jgi:hypothetical protein
VTEATAADEVATADAGTMSIAVELTSGMLVPDGMSTMAEVEVAFQSCLRDGAIWLFRRFVDDVSRAKESVAKDDLAARSGTGLCVAECVEGAFRRAILGSWRGCPLALTSSEKGNVNLWPRRSLRTDTQGWRLRSGSCTELGAV